MTRKIISYILILIVFAELFSLANIVSAANEPVGWCEIETWKCSRILPTCKPDIERIRTFEATCTAKKGEWELDAKTDDPLGTCKFYSSGTNVVFERTTQPVCYTKNYVGWKKSTVEEYNAEVAAHTANNSPPPVCDKEGKVLKDGKCVTPDTKYILLAPLPCESGSSEGCLQSPDGSYTLQNFDPTGDKGGNLGKYLNIMIRIFIGICAVLAVMMIVVGGIEYMTTDLLSSKEQGRHRISGAIFGLLLALGSWVLLNQINPDLLKTDLESLKDAIVVVTLDDSVPQTPINGKYINGATFGDPWTGTPSVLVGVDVRPTGDCLTIGQQNCTSLKGLQVGYLNKIKSGCPSCQLTVTGGTEFWLHGGKTGSTSHGPGSPTIDLRTTPELTKYIAGNKKLVYFTRYEKDGMSFLYEKNHWHVGP